MLKFIHIYFKRLLQLVFCSIKPTFFLVYATIILSSTMIAQPVLDNNSEAGEIVAEIDSLLDTLNVEETLDYSMHSIDQLILPESILLELRDERGISARKLNENQSIILSKTQLEDIREILHRFSKEDYLAQADLYERSQELALTIIEEDKELKPLLKKYTVEGRDEFLFENFKSYLTGIVFYTLNYNFITVHEAEGMSPVEFAEKINHIVSGEVLIMQAGFIAKNSHVELYKNLKR